MLSDTSALPTQREQAFWELARPGFARGVAGGAKPRGGIDLRRSRQLPSGSGRSFNAANGGEFHRQDIPASISPQKPHCVAGLACSSFRSISRLAPTRRAAESVTSSFRIEFQ
jgi:hypothetical protein